MEDMIKMRDTFREVADILDEFIALKSKEDSGDDIEKEIESILGRFMLKMMELESLKAAL
jgi:hypothetical protein